MPRKKMKNSEVLCEYFKDTGYTLATCNSSIDLIEENEFKVFLSRIKNDRTQYIPVKIDNVIKIVEIKWFGCEKEYDVYCVLSTDDFSRVYGEGMLADVLDEYGYYDTEENDESEKYNIKACGDGNYDFDINLTDEELAGVLKVLKRFNDTLIYKGSFEVKRDKRRTL